MHGQHKAPWLLIELGGSWAQTAQRDAFGCFWFTSGIVRRPGHAIALACPGVVRNGHILYATGLGWPDDADPRQELGVTTIPIIVNDAGAAALGESVLRSGDVPQCDLIYVSLGTGVGSARVANGRASAFDLGHSHIGGHNYCAGCRSIGCLNSELAASQLPAVLTEEDQAFVAGTLAHALKRRGVDHQTLLVLGGGIARRYPAIVSLVQIHLHNLTELTAAPAEAKSSAYAGLDYLAQLHENCGVRTKQPPNKPIQPTRGHGKKFVQDDHGRSKA